ncbi:putative transposase [Danaus plexippus plexippus]|uniref:Transposase n=1 Tax=Danaus plexippus plexippus TaxID=278856 RepID=A0A212ETA2_DANPL|nr:putative transposase [Danaus plexippus plexippus]
MSNFNTEFIMELFLDDNVSTLNRLIVATANTVNENLENISYIKRTLLKQQGIIVQPSDQFRSVKDVTIPYENKNFFELIVKNFTNEEYIIKFKMQKATVQALITFLKDHFKPGGSIVPLDKKVHVFLWALVNDCSFKEVGQIFGLHKSSVSYIFHEVVMLLAEQRYQFINWPSLEEQHITRVKVNSKYGFPNCVGFLDACRLKVGSKRKKRQVSNFILLQAVCDETLMFIDIHIGEIGNTVKGKVFRETQLSQELKNFIDFDNHILGDCEYKLRKNLLIPFSREELVSNEEIKFNEIHWKAHSYIGSAFGLLKERFQKLNHIDINRPDAVQALICAACVLHNFVLLHEGTPVKEEAVINDEGVSIDTNVVKSAVEKRQFICNYINYIHNLS